MPLGFMRHRQMHYEEKSAPGYVHNGHCRRVRHKCSICGAVRMERFMILAGDKTRFGNECWKCADKGDENHMRNWYRSY